MLIGFEKFVLQLSDDEIWEVVQPVEVEPPQREAQPAVKPDADGPDREVPVTLPLTDEIDAKVLQRMEDLSVRWGVDSQRIIVILQTVYYQEVGAGEAEAKVAL